MSAKTVIFVLCAQALLIQSALSQVCGRSPFASGLSSYGLIGSTSPFGLNSALVGNSLPCNGLAAIDNFTPAVEITPTTGGGLPVTSASPMAPNSLVVASDNVYEGTLEVDGDLPFIGTVGLQGVLPTTGTGAVNHACGNGATRMVSQDGAVIASGLGPAAGFAPSSIFNGIGAFGNTAAVSPFSFGTGLTGLGYPTTGFGNSGFAGPYPGVNNAFGFGAYGPAITPAAAYGGSGAAYGGAGEGNVAVAGELPVAGNAAVTGQVPIMGAVRFGGDVPAAGAVAISGKCACGCGSPYVF